MKKQFLAAASVLALSVAIAGPASARDGFYIGLRGGISHTNLNDVNENSTTAASADIDFDNVWMMSGAVGYRYNYFRAELEYIGREDHSEELAANTGTKFGSQSLMLNAYIDFMPNYVISPYIMAGVGYSRLELTTTSGWGPSVRENKNEEDNLTWAIGGGITIRLNKCLNFDGGYRYVDMGDIEQANVNAHEWYFGLRYTF